MFATLYPQVLTSQRFLGTFVLALAPFFARDLDAWIASRRWPGWTQSRATRVGLVSGACLVATAIWGF